MTRLTLSCAAITAAILALGATAFATGTGDAPSPRNNRLPANDAALGLVYDGLAPMQADGPCAHAYRLKGTDFCTHGPDPAPHGVDVGADVPAIPFSGTPPPAVQCDGDGIAGNRVQVLYAHASDVTDRFATYVNSFRTWAAQADMIYRNSAAETAGERHVRFVHNINCVLTVLDVTLPPRGDDTFDNMIASLQALGYNRSDRKYMVFMDANVYCGIGNVRGDDSPGAGNLNNAGPSYGRTDTGCWGANGRTPAHELMHNLGGVQLSAPHTSGGWHCTDEWDRMCYSDKPNYPPMTYLCPDPAHDLLFDCHHDDYFSTNPAGGSYLATHWNGANNKFLVAGPQSIWAYVFASNPSAASYTPSVQRNLTGAASRITRSGTGAYTVGFTNLGIYYGGTVDVTALGSTGANCKVSSWVPVLALMNVDVRCFDASGNPVDAKFAASFTRPVSSSSFAYVASGIGPAYQFNSTGLTNVVAHSATGSYQVTLPGLGGAGGTVKVSAFGGGTSSCKVGSWNTSGINELVRVFCQTPAGLPVDSKFTMTFHRSIGMLGSTTGVGWKRGYVWADQPSSASYTPSPAYSFNSAGGANSITRSGTGSYRVRFGGLATSRGHVQVTAYGPTSAGRCQLAGWSLSGSDQLVDVRCFDAAGVATDARYVVDFVD